jgi:hypothetical protein
LPDPYQPFCKPYFGKVGEGKIILFKKNKNGVKSAVKFIDDFEQVAADIAIKDRCKT